MSRCGVLRADRVVVYKSRREMLLLHRDSVLRTYRIALGRDAAGTQSAERATDGHPKAAMSSTGRNPKSAYHLSLHISYPNSEDCARAQELGLDPGGDIMIHGVKSGVRHPEDDWTHGCIAVTDRKWTKSGDWCRTEPPSRLRPESGQLCQRMTRREFTAGLAAASLYAQETRRRTGWRFGTSARRRSGPTRCRSGMGGWAPWFSAASPRSGCS